LAFLAFFGGVGMNKRCLAFFKPSGSVAVVRLEFHNFSDQRFSFFAWFRVLGYSFCLWHVSWYNTNV